MATIIGELKSRPTGDFILEDGRKLTGISFGAERSVAGEVVFNTGMVGYPEALTDPSYRGQILVLTYPSIGNYGVPNDEKDEFGLLKNFEGKEIHISALIVADYSHDHSHWASTRSLSDWLKAAGIPALYSLDTRQLTKIIREKGAMLGKIQFGEDEIPFSDPNKRNLVAEVSRKDVLDLNKDGDVTIIAVDCGIKYNIIRYLVHYGNVHLKVVPWDYDFNKDEYDGLFISNGPGDPKMAAATIENLRKAISSENPKPIFGICLGNQLLALAAGAKTYKMKFGNRGMNQPCIDLRTTLCYITPQNHGFAVDTKSLPKDWRPFFVNANDNSNEGIIHTYKPISSVQFHPEAMGGPTDTGFLFDVFLKRVREGHVRLETAQMTPPKPLVKKVVLLGSGGLSIGQAGEFDYSGSQAIKALKEENIEVVLINPNIATVQTSPGMADRTYFLPILPENVEKVIQKEKPDGILLQFGGQTALNCGIKLREQGILKKYNCQVLGTQIPVIEATEDREAFAEKLREIKEHVAPSEIATDLKTAVAAAKKIGYPVLVRAAFALGGLGSGFANDEKALIALVNKALSCSTQVIIDKSLRGWKEVEYEVVRDIKGNCITVCNMENFDPLGIHTGDSIVVAPSQTLSNKEYYKLRAVAIKVVRHLGVVGECNIQYALNPESEEYCIIEVNARLSRSSALASKATGYPLAYVAAKLALGIPLTDLSNSVTKETTACFEPSLDYMVIKIPRWDMRKFSRVSTGIGSAMKSVGEVMAIGRTFEEAFQKAWRMVDGAVDGFGDISYDKAKQFRTMSPDELNKQLVEPSDLRVFALAEAFLRGYSVKKLNELTFIDNWFLSKLERIIRIHQYLDQLQSPSALTQMAIRTSKLYGFSDKQIARLVKSSEASIRKTRKGLGILPCVKQIDTLAAEFPARTNYLYMTYGGLENDVVGDSKNEGVIVLGCGAYRIGSSCEFDWCAVSCIRTLRSLGRKAIMINYNPETVSTDYDECDKLYFEELTLERVLDIYEHESACGVIVSVGGQIANNLALPLHSAGAKIFGTTADSIDCCEDRSRFSELLDRIGSDQPPWKQVTTLEAAIKFADEVHYPVLIRPSYVLSGAAMNVAYGKKDLEEYIQQATNLNSDHPVVLSKFIQNAKEVEMDAVAMDGKIINYAISEHVENAGVHSGDATLILPPQKLYVETIKRVKRITKGIAKVLKISGPFNIQFLSKDNEIKVIECNMRASRSFPFVSKTYNVNFIDLATRIMVGKLVRPKVIDLADIDHVAIKAPMFSFTRLQGADPILRVEMASTGEVACFGANKWEAFLKSMLSTGFKIPKNKSVIISAGPLTSKIEFLESAKILQNMGYSLFGTTGTAAFFNKNDVKMKVLHKPSENKEPSILSYLKEKKIDLVINIPEDTARQELTDGYKIRRTAVDFNVSLISNLKCAKLLVASLQWLEKNPTKYEAKCWQDYMAELIE
eukprot:CAMPEP_0114505530 /NCGR_PEP_ID=MMETSP0109-20121206/10904_1 /TAXON_ID=29199 /ORGANISM="Chlorarachnion reptans, Strain CCCM449" /LENGTH=1462 /DNA_ID=CAMNT_0001683979 /DNA_START=76 /DNA_END=4464 /DNA_ORIENTATION=+